MCQALTPAAQYLRMSTDHQQYSLANQIDAIAKYATEKGFEIVKSYSDAAKSGLRLKNRAGLKQLLKDVIGRQSTFHAILVYDVSRWGRFQDTDEAACYEYLCKSAGVPVHYCTEVFDSDTSVAGLILKALKRTMAGEYSRELSAKVRAGLFRLATLGYKLGGNPAYGLRRQLLDSQGNPKRILERGERKAVIKERVTLVPGPAEEIAIVERVFREFADQHRSLSSIARRLNEEEIPYSNGSKWGPSTVTYILQNPQYVGTQVWGRTTQFLSSPVKRLPPQEWARCTNAFQPIISPELFERAQRALANITCRVSDEELLERLKPVLRTNGKLSAEIIQKSRVCAGGQTYYKRFGGLLNVYARLGYDTPGLCAQATSRQRGMLVRRAFIDSFLHAFPDELREVRLSQRYRSVLKHTRTGRLIAIGFARHRPTPKGTPRWVVKIPKVERKRLIILGFMNEQNTEIKFTRVFLGMPYQGQTFYVRSWSRVLEMGRPLNRVADLFDAIRHVTKPKPRKAAQRRK